jgi:hypothetical protein
VSIFGSVTIATQLEESILQTLEKWFHTYLVEYELQAGLIMSNMQTPKHPEPKSWLTSDTLDREASNPLPCICVVSPGLSTRNFPYREGDGSYRVFFNIGIGAFVSANTRRDTLKLCRIYVAICRMISLQKSDFQGFASGSEWLNESYDDHFLFTDDQTISAGQVFFEVEVAGYVNENDGPATVDPLPSQPGSDWPIVQEVDIDVEVKEELYT